MTPIPLQEGKKKQQPSFKLTPSITITLLLKTCGEFRKDTYAQFRFNFRDAFPKREPVCCTLPVLGFQFMEVYDYNYTFD